MNTLALSAEPLVEGPGSSCETPMEVDECEIRGTLKIHVNLGLQSKTSHLSYTDVLYIILKGIATETTFV